MVIFNSNKIETKTLNFWKRERVFEKSVKRKRRKNPFVFYEGPPYANGRPGIHHFLARAFKDIILRYKTMKGFYVPRRGGWDTHGLPTEIEAEKKLGISSKKEIEKTGIQKFIQECRRNVFTYIREWEKFTERMGYWIDLKHSYITCTPEYIETVWFILKKIWEKKLLYQDFKVVPYCPRCGTTLSSHELAQGYKKIKEKSIYVKFPILNPDFERTSLLIWTTTPWTLPGNVAVALNENFTYCKLKIQKSPSKTEFLILAKERVKEIGIPGEIVEEFSGKRLLNLYYLAPYPVKSQKGMTIYKTLPADFVTLEEGTGLVHIAPAFGEEDLELIKSQNLKLKTQNKPKFPILLTVNPEGKFNLEVEKFAGLFVKEADSKIIEDLKERGILFKEEIYEHDYPFCWRCKNPLLYYLKKSWFIKMTKVKDKLIKNNQKINWVPAHLKEGRFGEWLREIKDWALSRERYWGTPLPVWVCKSCKNTEVIGGRDDLRKKKFSKNKYFLLRHGESVMNIKGILISTLPEKTPCPLTKKGRKQISRVAKELKKEKIDLIFSSDLLRTRETAEIVGKELGIKPIFDKRLREIRAGIFEGKNIKEYESFWKSYEEKYKKKPKGAENYLDCKKRVYKFLKELEKKYREKTILIVSHQRPLAMLEGAVNGFLIDEFLEKIEKKKMKNRELRKIEFKLFPYNEKGELDFHKPYVDEIKFLCPKCQGTMERIPEVIDCWFDSGSMPFAQCHWPFEKSQIPNPKSQRLTPPKLFPADYISEGIDQTRGWFYTLLAISTLLGFGPPYKNVISLGHVLDEKGEKMSKSKGNIIDPWYIIGKYGADTVRWYFFSINQPGDSKLFSEKDVQEIFKKFILTFWNCFQFLETYSPKFLSNSKIIPKKIIDKWIFSRLNSLILETTSLLEKYDVTGAARKIEKFVIEDLSLWYIRRSRKRFQKPATKKELKEASQVLNSVLMTLSKLTAPFTPFLSEQIFQRLKGTNFKKEKSVHLESWPKIDSELIDRKLEKKMERAREIVSLALAERAKAKIKIRQPLRELTIPEDFKREPGLLELIKEEVNVKEISFGQKLKLDTEITPELKEEGEIREILRKIQQKRKETGLKPSQLIEISFLGDKETISFLRKNKQRMIKEGKIKEILFRRMKNPDIHFKTKINLKEIQVFIKKV
jgi:isoleucyl-tRNA synthetase